MDNYKSPRPTPPPVPPHLRGDAFVIPQNIGSITCNFCNVRKFFNYRNPKTTWVLCKDCQKVVDQAGPRLNGNYPIPGIRYTRPSKVDLTGPHGHATLPSEQFFWDSPGEKRPEFKNWYHPLEPPKPCRPNQNFSSTDDSSDDDYFVL